HALRRRRHARHCPDLRLAVVLRHADSGQGGRLAKSNYIGGMLELTPHTAAEYLRECGVVDADEAIEVRELFGGVSNTVLLVTRGNGQSFILKQALPRLKVPQE